MKPLLSAAGLLLSLSYPGSLARSAEPMRYVNPQGIEVIEARRPPAGHDAPASKPTRAMPSKMRPSRIHANGDSKLQISAPVQRSRDQDRLAILNQELATESKAFENKIKIMQTPSMKDKLSSDELARLQETMVEHEKNMRALRAEISRVRQSG